MPIIKTQGSVFLVSDDAAQGLASLPGMQFLNLNRSDETTELAAVKNDGGATISRNWIDEAEKISFEAVILTGYTPLKKGDVVLTKYRKGSTAARKFVVDSVSDSVVVGEHIKISVEATANASLEILIGAVVV